MKYWLFNKDPYNSLLESLYNWVVFHPLYNPTNRGPLNTAQLDTQMIPKMMGLGKGNGTL